MKPLLKAYLYKKIFINNKKKKDEIKKKRQN